MDLGVPVLFGPQDKAFKFYKQVADRLVELHTQLLATRRQLAEAKARQSWVFVSKAAAPAPAQLAAPQRGAAGADASSPSAQEHAQVPESAEATDAAQVASAGLGEVLVRQADVEEMDSQTREGLGLSQEHFLEPQRAGDDSGDMAGDAPMGGAGPSHAAAPATAAAAVPGAGQARPGEAAQERALRIRLLASEQMKAPSGLLQGVHSEDHKQELRDLADDMLRQQSRALVLRKLQLLLKAVDATALLVKRIHAKVVPRREILDFDAMSKVLDGEQQEAWRRAILPLLEAQYNTFVIDVASRCSKADELHKTALNKAANSMAKQPLSKRAPPTPTTAAQLALPKSKQCSFFARGNCKHGAQCKFLHQGKPSKQQQQQQPPNAGKKQQQQQQPQQRKQQQQQQPSKQPKKGHQSSAGKPNNKRKSSFLGLSSRAKKPKNGSSA